MIKDSRHLYGMQVDSPDEVRAVWRAFMQEKERRGEILFPNAPARTGLEDSDEDLEAYISDGRWVATCPECNGGVAVWSEMDDAVCYDCGTHYTAVKFPETRDRQAAEQVLLKRPAPRHMNWHPDKEDVADLKAENAVRGIPFTEGDE